MNDTMVIICPWCNKVYEIDNASNGQINLCKNCEKGFYVKLNFNIFKATYGTCETCKIENVLVEETYTEKDETKGIFRKSKTGNIISTSRFNCLECTKKEQIFIFERG